MASVTGFTAERSQQIEDTANESIALAREVSWTVAISDESTVITAANDVMKFRAPRPFTITGVRASLNNQSNAGNVSFGIKKNGSSILSTVLTIDEGEKTSVTAAVPAVLTNTIVADDDELSFDILAAGVGAYGAKITIFGERP